ncbi:hypothetical protein [Sulfurospirillum barnesii]|uniref:Uncharacterized protein n=1 Tax=Sulfurospirillum barnesii (strain ATCC 700032 / DSM 10660 / SES-3) TaxID=760154 RepID=I3Y0N6_SULBS|nr:hypothetical protein [Sulfurospirillum barnesii]AFL69760.1 hypothetical protein Sulba_2493 [Sulfurospirillum barnesii SES-3]
MFQKIKDDFLGLLYIFLEVIVFFLFLWFVVKPFIFPTIPSSLEIQMEAYEKAYGKKMDIPDYLRETLPKN